MYFCGILTNMHYMLDIHSPSFQQLPSSTFQKIMHMHACIDTMYVNEIEIEIEIVIVIVIVIVIEIEIEIEIEIDIEIE